jgi:hypothetical protein
MRLPAVVIVISEMLRWKRYSNSMAAVSDKRTAILQTKLSICLGK